jgi:class 3 adenylate cyclase
MADRLLATVLFTDIVDSTRHAAALGDRRWHRLLEEHNQAVRRNLASGPEAPGARLGWLPHPRLGSC